ncbi:MAG: DUF433 domain-containing protein [Acidobacteria bacterium]|nr:DUF433 domain-containing protein [Acidobacteriota bacterium]
MVILRKSDPYGGRDPRAIPAYNALDAAHYLRVPENTIRAWVFGRSGAGPRAGRRLRPVIPAADPASHLLSFINIVEVHVLDAIRRHHHVEMRRIRAAIEYLQTEFDSPHPLVDHAMETDGTDVFVREYGTLINASRHGQLAMRTMLDAYLKRIDRDQHGVAVRLFPFMRKRGGDAPGQQTLGGYPRFVSIDPRVAFGRPVISGSGIPTIEVAERFNAGESIEDLAYDYERKPAEIQEAIRCEAA